MSQEEEQRSERALPRWSKARDTKLATTSGTVDDMVRSCLSIKLICKAPDNTSLLSLPKATPHNIVCDITAACAERNTKKHTGHPTRDALYVFGGNARTRTGGGDFADLCLTTWLRCRFGAGNEARTRYLHLGKVALYRMSYARVSVCYSTTNFPLVNIIFHFPGFSI